MEKMHAPAPHASDPNRLAVAKAHAANPDIAIDDNYVKRIKDDIKRNGPAERNGPAASNRK